MKVIVDVFGPEAAPYVTPAVEDATRVAMGGKPAVTPQALATDYHPKVAKVQRKRRPDPVSQARRLNVLSMFNNGMKGTHISYKLDLKVSKVWNDLQVARRELTNDNPDIDVHQYGVAP